MSSSSYLLLHLLPPLLLLCPLTFSAPTPSPSPPSLLYSDIDAHAVIEPLLRPFSHMYDMMQENHKAMSYAEKIEQRRAESPLARSSGLFDLMDALQETTTTTTTQSPLRQLFAPYIDPFERGIKMFEQEMKDVGLIPTTTTTTTPRPTTTHSLIQKSIDLLFAPKQNENGESEPGLFASMLQVMGEATAKTFTQSEQEFRVKRRVKRQLGLGSRPSSPFDLFDNMLGFNDPVSITNPFTPNPLVSLFTTSKPLIVIPTPAPATPIPIGLPSLKIPSISDAAFRMHDPFYNPLLPNRKNKLWEVIEDMEKNNKKMMNSLNLH